MKSLTIRLSRALETATLATAFGITSRLVSVGVRFAAVPMMIKLVGVEDYGLWLIVLSVMSWVSMSDLGVPAALQNQLVALISKNEKFRARILIHYSAKLLGGLGLGVFIIGICAAFFFPWGAALGVPADSLGDFRGAVVISLLGGAIGLPARIGGVLYSATGKLAIPPLVELISQLCSFGALLIVVLMGWHSIAAFAACNMSGLLIGPVLATLAGVYFFRKQTRTAVAPPKGAHEDFQHLHRKGVFFFLTMIGELLVLQTDAFIIAKALGPAAVPGYLIPMTFFINFQILQSACLRPQLPKITRGYVLGERASLQALILKLLYWSLGAVVLFSVGLLWLGDWFIRLWSHGAATLSPIMAVGLCFYILVGSVDNILATVLNALGLIEIRLTYTIALGVSKVLVGYLILTRMGTVEYLPLGCAIVMLVASVPWAAGALRRTLATEPTQPLPCR